MGVKNPQYQQNHQYQQNPQYAQYQQNPQYQQYQQNPQYPQNAGPMPYQPQTVIIQKPVVKKNGLGTAGFVLALVALFLGWVPVVGWVGWALGLLFSFIGLFKRPRGLAVAGFVISFVWLIIFVVILGAMGGIASLSQYF